MIYSFSLTKLLANPTQYLYSSTLKQKKDTMVGKEVLAEANPSGVEEFDEDVDAIFADLSSMDEE